MLPLAGATLLALIALPAGPAASQVACDKPVLAAEGRMSGWGYARGYKEMNARKLSIARWEQTARELHGPSYARWAMAKGKHITCAYNGDHPWLRGRVSCVGKAIPCAPR